MDDREILEQIKDKIDIVSLISRYIPLKQAGKNLQANCPFHNEKTPSFMVSPQMQRYKCFGCQKSGDIFTFVMEYEHIDFREALEKLAKEAGVPLQQKAPQNKFYAILEMINKFAAEFYADQLSKPSGAEAKKYLLGRGYDEKTLKKFMVGYAPGNGTLHKYLMSKATFTQEQLLQSGLFSQDKALKEKFNKRIMFPIHSERGKIIAFSGRVMPGNDWGPKYLNSPETPIYHKRYGLFGLYQARTAIRADDLCILCEGQTDTISCHQAGINNIVAPLGTGLTDDQIELIKKYSSNILLLFDADSAGQQAVERAFIMCTAHNINTYAATPIGAKDLSEMAQKDASEITKIINNKQDGFTYLISNKLKNLDLKNYESYKNFIKYVGNLLQNVRSKDNLAFFLTRAEELSGISKENFTIQESRRTETTKDFHETAKEQEPQFKKGIFSATTSNLELELLSLIINYDQYKFAKNINPEYMQDSTTLNILKFINENYDAKNINERLKEFIEDEINEESIINALYFNEKFIKLVSTDIAKELFELYSRIKKKSLQDKIKDIRMIISLEENSSSPSQQNIDQLSAKINTLMSELNALEKEK